MTELPRYRGLIVASCPRCGQDLDDEGFSWWCSSCQERISANEVAYFDDGDLDD